MNDEFVHPATADADECHIDIPWSDRVAIWRMHWFPYRTYEWFEDDDTLGPTRWQWPNVLRRPHRD